MDCDHKLADHHAHLTWCERCGEWFAAMVDDDGYAGWRRFEGRKRVPV